MAIGNNMANFLTFSLRTKQALFEINKHSSKLYDSTEGEANPVFAQDL